MSRNLHKIAALIALTALVLTACGGAGGGAAQDFSKVTSAAEGGAGG